MKPHSLKQQLLAILIIIGLLPVAGLSLYTNHYMGDTLQESEQDRIANVNKQLSRHIKLLVDGMMVHLSSLQTNPILLDFKADHKTRVDEMMRLKKANKSFIDFTLYGRDGYLVCSTTNKHPEGRELTAWFENVLAGNASISLPNRILGEEELIFSIYIPICSKGGRVENVLVARHDFTHIGDLIKASTPGEEGKFVLLDQGGRLLKSSGTDSRKEAPFDPARDSKSWKEKPTGIHKSANGMSYLYSAQHFKVSDFDENSEWALIALQPLSSVQKLVTSSHKAIVMATLITLVIAILFGLIMSSQLATHIVKLNKTAQIVAGGDLDAKVEATGSREIRELAESFNQMVTQIKGHNSKLEFLVTKRTEKYRNSEKILKLTTARLHAAFSESKDGILITNADGDIIMGNQVFSDLLDFPQLENSGISETELKDHIIKKIEKKRDSRIFLASVNQPGNSFEQEINLIKEGEGDTYCVVSLYTTPISDSTGKVNGRLWTLRDLTEKRLLEESFRQSQKLEAIGTLAGGVAHDFNNLLTGIYGHLSLLEMEHLGANHSKKHDLLGQAMHASRRATTLVKNLLGFSRRNHIECRPCDAIAIVRETRDFISSTINPKINLDTSELDPNAWHVLSDSGLLNQITMNMSVNAADAMPNGGTLKYSSKNCAVDEKQASLRPDTRAGDYLCLIIEDTGEGIPESVQEQIFDPFFTTKGQGKGTGLGLSTCLGIANQLGGWIDFESQVGKGTTFYIYIPRSIELEKTTDKKPKKPAVAAAGGHGETLLLVDDEMVVRSVAEKLLSKMGYNIITASDGDEAIKIFEKGEHKIDLVLLDMTMPKKSGGETFTELRNHFDYVPILICSGYLVELSTFEATDGSLPDGFVQKPYKIETMIATVRDTIDQATEKTEKAA